MSLLSLRFTGLGEGPTSEAQDTVCLPLPSARITGSYYQVLFSPNSGPQACATNSLPTDRLLSLIEAFETPIEDLTKSDLKN